ILNDVVVRALRFHGVEAVGIPPLAAAVAEKGRLSSLNADPFDLMMDRGIVPVLHGDVVMDRASGASIVSGDQLVVHLASALGALRVGLATDVPGVLHEGLVIPRLRPEEVASLDLGGSSHTDVTGGMRGKIAELSVLVERGIEAHIFHVSRIRDYLEGSDHGGTILGGNT
ncbi:MAG: uridylate kinase, partial [Methanomicrobiales archaeon]|nr:uridylate kinase [Methanomicrobiales archaeon]